MSEGTATGNKATITAGLLGVDVTGIVNGIGSSDYQNRRVVNARLDEIERRILALETPADSKFAPTPKNPGDLVLTGQGAVRIEAND